MDRSLVALGLLDRGQLLDSLGDDAEPLAQLRLGDDERRRESNNIAVGRLSLHGTLLVSIRRTERANGPPRIPSEGVVSRQQATYQ
jgi:hypothetical protein